MDPQRKTSTKKPKELLPPLEIPPSNFPFKQRDELILKILSKYGVKSGEMGANSKPVQKQRARSSVTASSLRDFPAERVSEDIGVNPMSAFSMPEDVVWFRSDDGLITAYIGCEEDIAHDLIQTEQYQTISNNHQSVTFDHNGIAFVLVTREMESLARATAEFNEFTNIQKQRAYTARMESSCDLKQVKFSSRLKFLGESECIFCGHPFKNGQIVRRTACLHIFHVDCIEPWLKMKNICPIDKGSL